MAYDRIWVETAYLRRRYNKIWLREHIARTIGRRTTSLTHRRLAIHDELVDQATKFGGRRLPAAALVNADPNDFAFRFLDRDKPVVLRGTAGAWKAARWTPAMFAERFGEPTTNLLHRHPELTDDLDTDWFRTLRGDMSAREDWDLFSGGVNTSTRLQSGIAPNLFNQISGRTRWYLYPAKAAPFFAPPVRRTPAFHSDVDANDANKWPIAEAVPGWVADLEPGDVLFVPAFTWLQVSNLEPTLAVSHRWLKLKLAWRNSRTQTLLAATSTNPPVWRAMNSVDQSTRPNTVEG